MQTSILLDLESSASTLVAELTAINKIVDPDSAVGILARHSLTLAVAIENDVSCEVESVTS